MAAVVVAVNGVLSLAGGLWVLVAERDLGVLAALPLSGVFHWWIASGCYRRSARARSRRSVEARPGGETPTA